MDLAFSSYIECKVPDGRSGIWSVRTIASCDIPESALSIGETFPKFQTLGKFKFLYRNEQIIMTSTPLDVNDCRGLWEKATGSVLLTGLGLGCAISLMLNKPGVNDITVLENEIDVINLVAPSYKKDKIKIIHANAFEWAPPENKIYDCVWHDIFNDISEVDRDKIELLQSKYSKIAKWQESRGSKQWIMDYGQ